LLQRFQLTLSLLITLLSVSSASLFAQAWVFPKGGGAVTVSYQNIFVREHAFQDGDTHDTGHIISHALFVDTDYSLTDRLAVKVSLPYVASRYYGPRPHQLPIDDGKYHPTFQDFTIDVRYNLANRKVALTPFFRSVIPSHGYEYFAHSAAGRDQREYQLGVNAGRRLDPILPKTYVQARYSYAFVERILGIAANRSTVEAQAGYFVKPRVTLLGTTQWMHTHNGVGFDFALFHGGLEGEQWIHHDQIAKASLLDVGGGVAFALNSSTDFFVSAARSIKGANGHLHDPVISIGISRSFGNRFAVERTTTSRGPVPAPQTAFVCTCAKSK
jgi:hypothetical protein